MNHYFTHFDELFNELTNNWGNYYEKEAPQIPREACSLPKYPVNNCWLSNDTNTLNFEFAVAGHAEENIKVIGGKNSFTVRSTGEQNVLERGEDCIVLHNGISARKVDFTIKVDEQYDTKKAEVSFENGILKVAVPKAKDAESTILFG